MLFNLPLDRGVTSRSSLFGGALVYHPLTRSTNVPYESTRQCNEPAPASCMVAAVGSRFCHIPVFRLFRTASFSGRPGNVVDRAAQKRHRKTTSTRSLYPGTETLCERSKG